MFGSVSMNSDYTFTQSENRVFTTNISKALSSYLGKSVLPKTGQDNKIGNKNKDSEDLSLQLGENLNGDSEDDGLPSINYGSSSTIITSFEGLAVAVGAVGDKISKDQLLALLQALMSKGSSSQDNSKEIAFVKNLIAKFDALSKGADYITSLNGVNEPQDYETITPEQVTSPIDLRV